MNDKFPMAIFTLYSSVGWEDGGAGHLLIQAAIDAAVPNGLPLHSADELLARLQELRPDGTFVASCGHGDVYQIRRSPGDTASRVAMLGHPHISNT